MEIKVILFRKLFNVIGINLVKLTSVYGKGMFELSDIFALCF